MRNATIYGTDDLVNRFVVALREAAPKGSAEPRPAPPPDGVDARLEWAIFNQLLRLDVEVKLQPQRSREAIRRILGTRPLQSQTLPVFVAPYLSPAARDELEQANWSYWDATGNLLIQSRRPPVWIRETGSQREPTSGLNREKLRSLKGRAASELIVYLLGQGRIASVRELSRETGVSVATASRVVELLRDEELLEETSDGSVALTDRMRVAERWSQDYSFAKTFGARRYFSILGGEIALERIRSFGLDYAITGVRGAAHYLESLDRVAPFPSSEAWWYVSDREAVERTADLVPDRNGDLLIAEVEFLDRESTRGDSKRTVQPWRLVGDLLSAGGRLSAVGEDLSKLLVKEAPF